VELPECTLPQRTISLAWLLSIKTTSRIGAILCSRFRKLDHPTLVGWAPGNYNNPPDGDESRIYVTAIDATTVVVDYGRRWHARRLLPGSPLAEVPITDPDHDLTGARLYTENSVPFIAVWGQDQNAPPALPSIDVGTDIVPLRAPSIQKVFQS